MLVKRSIMAESGTHNDFCVGDVIRFALNDGEQVQAMAVQETDKGMLFMLVDCLAKEYPMFKSMRGMQSHEITYENSDLRKNLNGEILERFPEEIRKRMIAVNAAGDMLRLPTEKEIFGKNFYGEDEPDTVHRFDPMELRRNRIAFQGDNGEWEWYWLENRVENSAAYVPSVNSNGNATYYSASYASGVRPVFHLS